MLAYVFWHWRNDRVSREEYETDLRRFHQTLASNKSAGFNGSTVLSIEGAEWLDAPGTTYEEWYLLDDSAAMDPLNHAAVPLTYCHGLGGRRFPMTKHRTITGFVALALLTGAATAATLRPLPSQHHPNASAGIMSFSELKVDVNKLATDDYDDQSFVYSAKRN